MDNLFGADNPVAFRNGHFVYHGRFDPYPAGNCNNHGAGEHYSREKISFVVQKAERHNHKIHRREAEMSEVFFDKSIEWVGPRSTETG